MPAAVMSDGRSPRRPIWVMVQRSPFLTQSVALRRRRRLFHAGDDYISDTGPVPVGQGDFGYCRRVIEPMRPARRLSWATR